MSRSIAITLATLSVTMYSVVNAPVAHASNTAEPDSYWTSHIQPALTGPNVGAAFTFGGEYNPPDPDSRDCTYSPCGYSSGGAMHGTTYTAPPAYGGSSVWQVFEYPPGTSGIPAFYQGNQASTGVAGPFNTNDALSLNGGIARGSGGQTFGDFEWCGYFDPGDRNGQIIYSTYPLASDGTVTLNELYVAVGTTGGLVVAVRGSGGHDSSGNPLADIGLSDNGFGANGNFNNWDWMCVGYNAASQNFIVHWPNGGVQTFNFPGGFRSNYPYWGAAGNLGIYGYSFWPTDNGGDGTYQEPSCALTSSCGTGPGSGPPGSNNCAQNGIISGTPKFQWCYPQLGCLNDWSLNVGEDIAQLSCDIAQIVIGAVGSMVNSLIDLAVPDVGAIQTQWTTAMTTMQTHVPMNYIVGGLGAIPTAFSGAHTTPSLSFSLPPPWNSSVTLTWANFLSAATPYRPLMAGLVYLSFATMVVVKSRRAFEN